MSKKKSEADIEREIFDNCYHEEGFVVCWKPRFISGERNKEKPEIQRMRLCCPRCKSELGWLKASDILKMLVQ